MSRKRYPQINSTSALDEPHDKMCGASGCRLPARGVVRVEFSFMRGEDEFVYSCSEHARACYRDPKSFCKRFPKEAWTE